MYAAEKTKKDNFPLPELADFAIITVISEELDAVLDILGLKDTVTDQRTYYYGRVDTVDRKRFVVCTKCRERGNVSASDAASDVITRWKPLYLLLVGIAGGVWGSDPVHKPRIGLGDVVAHDELYYYELVKESANRRMPRPMVLHESSARLLDVVQTILTEKRTWWDKIGQPRPDGMTAHPELYRGRILSGEKLLGDPKSPLLHELLDQHTDALAVEMESGGIAHTLWEKSAHEHNPDFLVLRGISDYADAYTDGEKNQETRDKWRIYAARSAASVALAVIQNYTTTETVAARLCPKCGRANPPNANFCANCDEALTKDRPSPREPSAEPSKRIPEQLEEELREMQEKLKKLEKPREEGFLIKAAKWFWKEAQQKRQLSPYQYSYPYQYPYQYRCRRCGQALTWDPQRSRWFCSSCLIYW
jgi:nucleoside phosphorylase